MAAWRMLSSRDRRSGLKRHETAGQQSRRREQLKRQKAQRQDMAMRARMLVESHHTQSVEQELRVDPADGNEYSRASFVQQYGGTAEWEAAAPSVAGAQAEDAPTVELEMVSGGGGGGGGGRMVVPGFGVHPWFVQDAAPGWEERLAGLLERHPGAIVGEVGLCKAAKNLRKPKDEEQPGQTGGEVAPAAAAAKAEAGGTVEVEADCIEALEDF